MNHFVTSPLARSSENFVIAGLLLIGGSASAADFNIGAGAGIDRGKTDCVAALACDHGSTHTKLFVGYEAAPNVELQVQAFDAGSFDGGDTTPLGTTFGGRFKVSGVALAAGYRWTFSPGWSLKGQAGIASVRAKFDYAAPFAGEVSKSTVQPLVGLSLGYSVTPNWRVSLDLDDTRFKVYRTRGSLQMFGVAAQYSF